MHISSSSGRCLNGLLLASLLFCLTAITTGCALLKKKKGDDLLPGADESILSIHRYYPTINSQVHKGIVTLQHVSGKPVYVDSSPLISLISEFQCILILSFSLILFCIITDALISSLLITRWTLFVSLDK